MPTLHALFVAINQYPNPRNVLQGCIHDMVQVQDYLRQYCAQTGAVFRPLVITDEQATRANVVAGFDHFEAAAAADCCLFYYSGHGSRSAAPDVFRESAPDHSLESIVCWDSREPGGYDLMDKELSYLIWRAGRNKELPFITIMDCCHSGKMRAQDGDVTGVRTLRDVGGALPASEFLGLEHFKKTKEGQLLPPLGRRVHLAAARDTELAREIIAGGQPRGIFTWCLMEALQITGPLVSYADLLNRVNLRIRQNVKDQSAQIEATFPEDKNRGFLFSRIDAERPAYLIAWDKALDHWTLQAGALHGITAGDAGSQTLLELTEDGRQIQVETVMPDRSKVGGMEGSDTKRVYTAVVRQRAIQPLELAFAAGSDPEGISALTGYMRDRPFDLFRVAENAKNPAFLLHARNGAYFLSRCLDATPLFQRVAGYDAASANTFLRQLDKVARWTQVLELQHADSGIQEPEIDVALYRLTEARKTAEMDNDVPVETVDWQAGAVQYTYFRNDGTFLQPAFQLKIRNTGKRTLWIGVLYLGSDFSISNALLPKVALAPGEEAWAADIADGYAYRTIPLQIDDESLAEIEEYLKVLISTEELNTDVYYQKGLAADAGADRAILFRQQPATRDWATKTLCLQVKRGG